MVRRQVLTRPGAARKCGTESGPDTTQEAHHAHNHLPAADVSPETHRRKPLGSSRTPGEPQAVHAPGGHYRPAPNSPEMRGPPIPIEPCLHNALCPSAGARVVARIAFHELSGPHQPNAISQTKQGV